MTQQSPVLVTAAEAEVVADGPHSRITLLAEAEGLTVNRSLLREGSAGAPPHFHTRVTETFFVLDGVLDVLLDDRIVTVRSGDLLVVPPRVPHAFAPAAGREADVLVTFSPGIARFDYYRLLGRVASGAADPAEIAASSAVYDNHYFDSAVWRAR